MHTCFLKVLLHSAELRADKVAQQRSLKRVHGLPRFARNDGSELFATTKNPRHCK